MENQNKGISTLAGIIIILIVIIAAGGIAIWQLPRLPKEEIVSQEDETANWKTYRNEEYGFEVKYPSENWGVEEGYKNYPQIIIGSTKWRADMPEGGATFVIYIRDVSLDDFISEYKREHELYCDQPISEIEDFKLGGVKATKMTACTALGLDMNYIFARKNNESYIISYQEFDPIHKQILSTFRFLE